MENLSKLLLPEIQEFIIKNTDQDAAKLSFAKNAVFLVDGVDFDRIDDRDLIRIFVKNSIK